jgi:predicted TIM-barrel fold metal-dependent hydrolase
MVASAPSRAPTPAERVRRLRLLDTDIHNDLPSAEELRPFLATEWQPWLEGGLGLAGRAYANTGSGHMDDVVRPEDGLCAGDPQWVIDQLMTPYGIDIGVLTGTLMGIGVGNNGRALAALARAYNDWTLHKWVRPHACFKGCILITPQNVDAAVQEIHRLGDDPGMVQVMMCSAARTPFGNPAYWPIYRAAVEHGLPVGIHVGSEGLGIANPPTSAGYSSNYIQFHTDLSQTMMAHCISLVTEGVFQEFPTLKFAFIEGGIGWVPHVMWRLDRLYPALKAEVPYLKLLPSAYILRNCYFSTQPIEEPDNHRHLLELFAMLQAERTVVFASDYPHWDFDNPTQAFSFFPADLKRRIFVDNVLDLYGPRLLAPSVAR